MRTLALVLCLAFTSISTHAQNSAQPVEITANQMELNHAQGSATFSGNVVVTQANLTLTAPQLTVTYNAQSGTVNAIRTNGSTTITRQATTQGAATEIANGTQATYTPATQQLVLTGNVTLTRGSSQLSGDKLVYNLQNGNAKVTNSSGPVKARFIPPQSNKTP